MDGVTQAVENLKKEWGQAVSQLDENITAIESCGKTGKGTEEANYLPRLNGSAQDALQLLKSLQFQLDLLAQQLPTFDEVQSGQATLKSWDEQYKKTLLLGNGEESTIRRRNLQTSALAQPNKRLCSLSEHVPHGYRRKSLFEGLIRYNVLLLRATWFIKVTYLNQLQTRQTPNSISVAGSDNQRSQWTKDVVEYLQHMLDEFCSKEGAFVHPSFREQSSPGPTAGTNQIKMKTKASPAAGDIEEHLVHFKWWYMVAK
ncbi:RNA polymerase II transcription mediators [Zea mays]|uniref:RNA polymerase II transcription mediators n=1 Tax=Zea mays TaxID=4577 RepID=A0A1D6K6F0_MAIZE|nr:RNA polymerase II transcription mediators [Zea mays]